MGDIDEGPECKEELQEALSDANYDFFICACNNARDKSLEKPDYTMLEKTVTENKFCMLAANWYDANRIIKLLEKEIGVEIL